MVTDFEWLDINKLKGIDEEFAEILETFGYMDDVRKDTLCSMLSSRIEMLQSAMNQSIKYTSIGDIGKDVEEDIAYSGQDSGITMQ